MTATHNNKNNSSNLFFIQKVFIKSFCVPNTVVIPGETAMNKADDVCVQLTFLWGEKDNKPISRCMICELRSAVE